MPKIPPEPKRWQATRSFYLGARQYNPGDLIDKADLAKLAGSSMIERAPREAERDAAPFQTQPRELTADELAGMSAGDLKDLCRSRELPAGGTKQDLIGRLLDADTNPDNQQKDEEG